MNRGSLKLVGMEFVIEGCHFEMLLFVENDTHLKENILGMNRKFNKCFNTIK